MKIFPLLGWTGTALILIAYFLISFSFLSPENIIYPFLNIAGSVLLALNLWERKAPAAMTLQVIWILIALGSLGKIFLGL